MATSDKVDFKARSISKDKKRHFTAVNILFYKYIYIHLEFSLFIYICVCVYTHVFELKTHTYHPFTYFYLKNVYHKCISTGNFWFSYSL